MSMLKPVPATQIPRLIAAFYGSGRTLYMRGSPGIGKTDLVNEGARMVTAAYTAANVVDPDVKVYELHLASMSEVDIRGYLIPNGGNATFTKPVFATAVESSPRGILFLDEFPQATHEVQKAVAPLLLKGEIGDFKLPDGWMVVACGNLESDNAGVQNLLQHVVNRLCIVDVEAPTADDWIEWAARSGLSLEAITFAKMCPGVLVSKPDLSSNDRPYCTPRSLHALDDVARRFPGGYTAMMSDSAGFAIVAGFIGEGAAAELRAVVTLTSKLPKYEDIVANPDTITLPTELNEQYASIMMVGLRAKVTDNVQAVKYIARYNPNLASVGMCTLASRDMKFACAEMAAWISSNVDFVKRLSKYMRVK